jgi:hypothetical protein
MISVFGKNMKITDSWKRMQVILLSRNRSLCLMTHQNSLNCFSSGDVRLLLNEETEVLVCKT